MQAARLGRHQGAAWGGGQAAAEILPLGQAGTQAPQKTPRTAQMNELGMEKLMHWEEPGLALNHRT